jgi:hypothetical protein
MKLYFKLGFEVGQGNQGNLDEGGLAQVRPLLLEKPQVVPAGVA